MRTESNPGWSLRSRLLRWLGLTTGAGALTLSLVGAWFVVSAADRQADALLQEELDEVRASFGARELDIESFVEVTHMLSDMHPASRFAWRAWDPAGRELGDGFGELGILRPGVPAREPLDRTVEVEGGFRWRATRLEGGQVVGLLLDERPHRVLVDQYVVAAVVFAVLSLACVFLVGQTFSSRVARLLARIASRAREVHAGAGTMALSGADLPVELRDVVQALEEMLVNIRSETEASRVMIAGMAHELRAPIQNLVGEAEVALMGEQEPEAYREALASQLEELRRMGDAVHNLVALCSARRAAEAERTEDFDLERELRFRLERELRRAEREGFELSFEARGDLRLRGDREALLTAVRNLVFNALDWSPEGGRVELSLDGTGAAVEVRVDDEGPGIPVEARSRLFEPFERGAAAAGRRVGYGLGLALARSAVETQGGEIRVTESPSGGARLELTLPRARAIRSRTPCC